MRLGILLACAIALLCSCTQDRALPFEIIDQGESLANYQEPDPDLYVFARPRDLTTLPAEFQLPAELAEQLKGLDYGDCLAIVVSRGHSGGTSPDLIPQIRQVIRRGNEVIIRVHFGEINPDKGIVPAESNPYQAIAVSKEGWWGQRVRFVLEVDGEEVKQRMYYVP
jgi:hypothetical protein